MPASTFLPLESPVAQRQPKTDRLILEDVLARGSVEYRIDEGEILAAHAILVRWADLESSGVLSTLNETQMQGDFLAQVFGHALGYASALDGQEVWHRQQHHEIAGETPDAVLGFFRAGQSLEPLAVVELKGPTVHLDRDRSRGRTAVSQLWDYLVNTPPECRWGVLSNIVSFRLYEGNSTKRRYEHFTLQSLRDPRTFRQFFHLFHRTGLIDRGFNAAPRAALLLEASTNRQRVVGEELYDLYSKCRMDLIEELHFQQGHPVDLAIEMAQRLLDRIIFIAFCEDRRLLPDDTIRKAYEVAGFHRVTNPRWQSFKQLFRFIDQGEARLGIDKYNGGLFAKHPADDLDLEDEPWTEFFRSVGKYGFADEVNLDVLGHLFERSITEVEKLKLTGFFGANRQRAREYAEMPQSVKRKQLGVYYTPPELTSRIVQYTVEELIDERFAALAVKYGVSPEAAGRGIVPDDPQFWHECLAALRSLKILDPACGSGAFLFQTYNTLELRYNEVIGHLQQAGIENADELEEKVASFILNENLYGVDVSAEAVEITQLALWIRSATRGQLLTKLSENIVQGNSLVHQPAVHPLGFNWRQRFPAVFNREESGFDCVIGNPPWERIKLQEREFFSLPAPEIATATDAAKRRKLVARLESDDPALFGRYTQALDAADALLTYCRRSGEYPLTGKGDINTYAVFAELAYRVVAPHGRVGLLVPSGIAMHQTTSEFFGSLIEENRLRRLIEFDNRLAFFPDVHRDTQFVILSFLGANGQVEVTDYLFGALRIEDLEDKSRHVRLSSDDIKLCNPNTKTCPIFHTRRDADITKRIYRRIPVLIDQSRRGPTGNPWGIKFSTMFHQTNDAELFREGNELKAEGFKLNGNVWEKRAKRYLPIYEGKMFERFNHRFQHAEFERANWLVQYSVKELTTVELQNPEAKAIPRFWVNESDVVNRFPNEHRAVLAFRDITNPTNTRTFIAAYLPYAGFTNKAILCSTTAGVRPEACLLACWNSFACDFVVRQKLQGKTLNFFIVEQLPILPPDAYDKRCPWDERTTLETWISERVLRLTCTAEDMLPLAEACDFTSGSFRSEYQGRLNKWDEAERAELMAELDAAYFHLYGIDRDDAEYILSTFKGIHDRQPLFPGGVSTRDRILQKYAEMSFAG